jgi:hypothetical protein
MRWSRPCSYPASWPEAANIQARLNLLQCVNQQWRSDVMGQKRCFDRQSLTSDLPQLADILGLGWRVSKVPISEVAASFDHLIGAREARGRYRKAKASGGLEVDDKQLVLCWSLYWQIARLFTSEDAIDMTSRSRRNARSDYAAPIGQLYIPGTFADHHLF